MEPRNKDINKQNLLKKTKDTIIIKYLDSSSTVEKVKGHVILIQENKKESPKSWEESPLIISFLIPILVASLVAWFTYRLNIKKNNIEIDKLKEETENLKKTFQPIVIGTLQSIQDKIITSKIDALKLLVQIRNRFTYHEQQFCEGDPITPDFDRYLELLFYNFSIENYNEYKEFHDDYSYLFPDKVFEILEKLYKQLTSLNENKKSFNSMDDADLEPYKKDKKDIEEIIDLFKEAILVIRKDCHLDTSFVHDFIEENKGLKSNH